MFFSKMFIHEFLIEDSFAFLANSGGKEEELKIHASSHEDDLGESFGDGKAIRRHR